MDQMLQKLIDEIRTYDKDADPSLIQKAYDMAKKAHEGQTRSSGEQYFGHPVQTALILAELKLDTETICAGLLHDVVEETPVTTEQVKAQFGDEVASLVEGATKTSKVSFDSPESYTAENLRKIILATINDPRVMFIKLADRLHNMRTLKHIREDKQKRIAKETLEIYAPIAHKLGLYSIKGELEDLSLRYLKPQVYQYLKKRINAKRDQREEKAQVLMDSVRENLKSAGIEFFEVSGRAKYFYSIYKKMIQDNKSFDEIYDLIAIRIIVRTVPDCYKTLALIHQLWKPIPQRFKDYISVPKSNGYQSLHTDVATNLGVIMEVQIRTMDMHQVAKYGMAAHWRYKGTERDKMFDRRISWLEQMIDWRQKADAEFLDNLKINFFQDEIVVFTPRGDPIILPEGSTPVDFAFEVHTWVGSHCVKAEVNSKIVSLDTKLRSGDIVNIITQNNAKPSRNWLGFVVTSKARQKIRSDLGIESDKDPKSLRSDLHSINLAKFIGYRGKRYNVKISKCCSANFKDRIVAYVTKDKALTVHKVDCPNIHALDQSKKVEVFWDIPKSRILTYKIYVNDKLGMVTNILNVLAEHKIEVISINVRPHKKTTLIHLEIRSDKEEEEKSTVSILKAIPNVSSVVVERDGQQ